MNGFRQDRGDRLLLQPNAESVELEPQFWNTQDLTEISPGLFEFDAIEFRLGYLNLTPVRVKEVA